MGMALSPNKTDPPLIVNPNAMTAGPITAQGFELIARRTAQIVKPFRRRQHHKLALRTALDVGRQTPNHPASRQCLSTRIGKATDHIERIRRTDMIVKQSYRDKKDPGSRLRAPGVTIR